MKPITGKNTYADTAVVSIHDVRPASLPRVTEIVRFLQTRGVDRMTLLVIPGEDWAGHEILQLRRWRRDGLELAGHGWQHRAGRPRTLYHRLHGLLMSRDEAEHLSLAEDKIKIIIRRCHGWFGRKDLSPPDLYVPPAWAMGRISRRRLRQLPFALYETLAGLYDAGADRFFPLPVTGYMADTRGRARVLKFLNGISRKIPLGPVRLALHPEDLNLPLRKDLERHLAACRRFCSYTEACRPDPDRIDRKKRGPASPPAGPTATLKASHHHEKEHL